MIHFVHIDLYRFIFYTIFYFNTKIIKFHLFDKCIKFQELDINTFSVSSALQTIYIDEKTKAISKFCSTLFWLCSHISTNRSKWRSIKINENS